MELAGNATRHEQPIGHLQTDVGGKHDAWSRLNHLFDGVAMQIDNTRHQKSATEVLGGQMRIFTRNGHFAIPRDAAVVDCQPSRRNQSIPQYEMCIGQKGLHG